MNSEFNIPREIKEISKRMKSQDNRSTSFPIFIVVEDKKVYGVDRNYDSDGQERASTEYMDSNTIRSLYCEECFKKYEESEDLPEYCDECDSDAFVNYRIERDRINDRAGFFFTEKACEDHIKANRHHYDSSVHSYVISAYYNEELKLLMDFLKSLTIK